VVSATRGEEADAMDDSNRFGAAVQERRRNRQRMMIFRWVLVGLSAVLALVLIASGAVVVGAVIGAMAVVRTVMFLQWRHHARGFRPGARHLPRET
jgi:inner membrane protein involved in colicin E2 resistance